MKYEYKKGQYIIEIDYKKKIVIIEDIFKYKFINKILLNINININISSENIIKNKINKLLDYNFEDYILVKMLKLSIEDNEEDENVFNIGKLKIEDYGIHTALTIMKKLEIYNNKFCFIGGQILRFYNVNRQTSDTDILLLADNNTMLEIKYHLELLNISIDYFHLDDNSNDPVLSLMRFIYEGVEVDMLSTKYNFQELAIKNSKKIKISNGEKINIISLKDLIIFKIYANSYKDLSDADALIRLNYNNLSENDLTYIRNQLRDLGKEKIFDKLINNE